MSAWCGKVVKLFRVFVVVLPSCGVRLSLGHFVDSVETNKHGW